MHRTRRTCVRLVIGLVVFYIGLLRLVHFRKKKVELLFLSKSNKSYESYVKYNKSYRKSYASPGSPVL